MFCWAQVVTQPVPVCLLEIILSQAALFLVLPLQDPIIMFHHDSQPQASISASSQALDTQPAPPTAPVAQDAAPFLDATVEHAPPPDIAVMDTGNLTQVLGQQEPAEQLLAGAFQNGVVAATSGPVWELPSAPVLPDIFREGALQSVAAAAAITMHVGSRPTPPPAPFPTRTLSPSNDSNVASSTAGLPAVNSRLSPVPRNAALPSPWELTSFTPMSSSLYPEVHENSIFNMIMSRPLAQAPTRSPTPSTVIGDGARASASSVEQPIVSPQSVAEPQAGQAASDPSPLIPETKIPARVLFDVADNAGLGMEDYSAAAETAVDALPPHGADRATPQSPHQAQIPVEDQISHPDAAAQGEAMAATTSAAVREVSHLDTGPLDEASWEGLAVARIL